MNIDYEKAKNVFSTLLCCVSHKVKDNEWHHIEHMHDDWVYSTTCKRCGTIVCSEEKPKNGWIIEHEPNKT